MGETPLLDKLAVFKQRVVINIFELPGKVCQLTRGEQSCKAAMEQLSPHQH